jgi:hypothetical protein
MEEINKTLADLSRAIGLAEGLAEDDSWFAERRNADEIIAKATTAFKAITEATQSQQQEIEGLKAELQRIREGVGELCVYNADLFGNGIIHKVYIKSDLDNLIGKGE